MLTEKDLQHIANLARIKLSKDEERKFSKELGMILDFIGQLNKVDTSKVEPAYQITGLVNSFRADEHRKDFEMNEDLNEKLIGQAPHTENRFIKVRSVLNKK
ncbi:MAG: Asp-tRNA(Asn)/Glu-tRNA(Gln) amidotransferase subunit GatC [Candidatus Wildermuthbacteria bacterium]|nr:Asp-tRNA(Asn)/Glu-tRNA(Gln) amidotransferase subunit GatC [Candidatus Wildermuthbacteria bacterium]